MCACANVYIQLLCTYLFTYLLVCMYIYIYIHSSYTVYTYTQIRNGIAMPEVVYPVHVLELTHLLLFLKLQPRRCAQPQTLEDDQKGDHAGIWELPKIGVPCFGVLIIRILLFRVLY